MDFFYHIPDVLIREIIEFAPIVLANFSQTNKDLNCRLTDVVTIFSQNSKTILKPSALSPLHSFIVVFDSSEWNKWSKRVSSYLKEEALFYAIKNSDFDEVKYIYTLGVDLDCGIYKTIKRLEFVEDVEYEEDEHKTQKEITNKYLFRTFLSGYITDDDIYQFIQSKAKWDDKTL